MSQFQQPPPPSGHPVAPLCDRLGARLDDIGDPAWWSLADAELTQLVRVTDRQVRRLEALRTSMVAEAQRRDLAKTVGATGPVPWLAGALTMTRPKARQVCRLATDLDHGVDATRAAFGAGMVDADQAQAVATAVHALPAEVGVETRREAEAFLLEQAAMHDAQTLAGLGQHLLERVAPDLAEARLGEQLARADARDEQRRNTFTGTTDHRGRIRLRGELDTESWTLVASALEPLAKPAPTVHADGTTEHDPRTVGQRNADALVELARRMLDTDGLPSRGGYPAHLAVTIDLDTLTSGIGVGILDTGAPISAADVRRIACDCTVLPVLLGTDGIPLDVGRAIRVFTKELRRAVEVRDIGCAFPGCARPASWCQVHHILHWADGGPTSLDNGVLLCGAHHRLIHQGQWHVRLGTDRRPELTPPTWVDPAQRPRRNLFHLRC